MTIHYHKSFSMIHLVREFVKTIRLINLTNFSPQPIKRLYNPHKSTQLLRNTLNKNTLTTSVKIYHQQIYFDHKHQTPPGMNFSCILKCIYFLCTSSFNMRQGFIKAAKIPAKQIRFSTLVPKSFWVQVH